MKTADKVKYIEGLVGMTARANGWEAAREYACFARGAMCAWNVDLTISLENYQRFNRELEVILETKRKLEWSNEDA